MTDHFQAPADPTRDVARNLAGAIRAAEEAERGVKAFAEALGPLAAQMKVVVARSRARARAAAKPHKPESHE